jgi:hypothetical protein
MKIWSESRFLNLVVIIGGLFFMVELAWVFTHHSTASFHRAPKSGSTPSGGKPNEPGFLYADGGI